jgi:hypothetical protein
MNRGIDFMVRQGLSRVDDIPDHVEQQRSNFRSRMDRNLEEIAMACAVECERQHVGIDRLT